MPWQDETETFVGISGDLYVAPVGSTLPEDLSAPADPYVGLGFVTEDGVTPTVSPEIVSFGAWQSRQPIRREMVGQAISIAFSLEQWNEETVLLAFGGGEVTDIGGGLHKYTFPSASDALDERVLVLDTVDGDTNKRYVFPRGSVTGDVATTFRRNELSVLPITFEVLSPASDPNGPPGYFITDSTAFAAGS